MMTAKTYDITYPGVTAEISTDIKSIDQLVTDAGGGTPETARIVRPARMEYDYVAVARNQ